MNTTAPRHWLAFLCGILLIAAVANTPAGAQGLSPAATSIVDTVSGVSRIDWVPRVQGDGFTLTVAGPNGFIFQKDFASGTSPYFDASDSQFGGLPDGGYEWEIWVKLPTRKSTLQALQNGPESPNGRPASLESRQPNVSGQPLVQFGHFMILGGSIISAGQAEPSHARPAPAAASPAGPTGRGGRGGNAASSLAPENLKIQDQVIADDLIVQGSECVGLDCVNNESFGFDTLRLKENNTRIKFNDTSTSAGFPNHNWELVANDSASGGAEKFSIQDDTAATVPFTIEGSSPNNSIYVDSTGRVGFRTSTPVLDLHILTGNTPGIRLDQNSSGGFSPQAWDVAGNETSFFVRDVTNGSHLPFRIFPNAPNASLAIASSGNVGIGTVSPTQLLTVQKNADANIFGVVENDSTGLNAAAVLRAQSDTATVNFQAHASTRTISRFGVALGGWAEFLQVFGNGLIVGTNNAVPLILGTNHADVLHIAGNGNIGLDGVTNPTNPIQHISGARLTAGGLWVSASSRAYKMDIHDLPAPVAMAAFKKLDPVQFRYKRNPSEHHLGFIAEDVPDIVAMKDRKGLSSLDIVALLTKVVQEQQKQIDQLSARVKELESTK
jgi:Chaperone of endosialidase